jgi:hypothetical protein
MDIDFDKLLGDDEAPPTNPRDIFLTLDKSPSFSFLRDIQSDVLDAWYKERDLYQIPLIRTRGPIGAVRWT